MYIEYWKLYKRPFENVTDPAFFYASREHQEALSRMFYVVSERKAGLLLLGDYGVGKTFLSRALMAQCPADKYRFIYIVNPRLSALEMLSEICLQLNCSCQENGSNNKVKLLHEIEYSLKKNHENGKHNILIFDEAQSIPANTLLEEIRLLLNTQTDTAILFTLLLVGQPTVMKDMQSLPQLIQRLGVRYRLSPFNPEETKQYVKHRLRVAGLTQDIFTDGAFIQIHNASGGIARAINNVCDMALLTGFIKRLHIIDEDIIHQVAKDLKEGLAESQNKEENTYDRVFGGIQEKKRRRRYQP